MADKINLLRCAALAATASAAITLLPAAGSAQGPSPGYGPGYGYGTYGQQRPWQPGYGYDASAAPRPDFPGARQSDISPRPTHRHRRSTASK
jgi:hypothetical protein